MFPRQALLAIICSILLLSTDAVKHKRCALTQKLLQYPSVFNKGNVSKWVCLIENESSSDTSKIGGPNSNGSKDYGLFQINSRYWCGIGRKGGDCNITCESLLQGDGVSVAVNCVKKIYARHGFDAWYGWKNKCAGKKIANAIKECKL